jgi:Ca2+-binding EF-hand superfamily protein
MRQALWVFVFCLGSCAAPAWAQRSWDGGGFGGPPWGGSSGFGGGGFDPKEMIRRADQNRNGTIEPSEMTGPLGGMLQRLGERAGFKPGNSMPVDKLMAAMDPSRTDFDKQRSNQPGAPAAAPLPTSVASFELPTAAARVPGFEVPLGIDQRVPLDKRFDPKVYERARESMRDRDRNKNDVLDGEEWTRSGWDPPLSQSDLDQDGVISLEELCFRYQGKAQADNPKSFASGQMKFVQVKLPPPPLFPGLSTPASNAAGLNAAQAPAGGVPLASFPQLTSAVPPAAAAPLPPADEKMQKFADIMIGRADLNQSGKLEREEWGNVRDPEAADANRDGVITRDEMIARLQAWGGRGDGDKNRDGEKNRDGGKNRDGERTRDGRSRELAASQPAPATGVLGSIAAKSYLAAPPRQRLPEGLPNWFFDQDSNGDGQVSMAEFLADSESLEEAAEKFQNYDTSGDGLVSPQECLDSQSSGEEKQDR